MISDFLKDLKKKGWKQVEIAKKCGITTSFLSELIHGDKCGIDTIIKIADAFNVTTDEVLGRTKPSETVSPKIEKIIQVIGDDEELAASILRRAEDEKLIKEVRGREGRGKAA